MPPSRSGRRACERWRAARCGREAAQRAMRTPELGRVRFTSGPSGPMRTCAAVRSASSTDVTARPERSNAAAAAADRVLGRSTRGRRRSRLRRPTCRRACRRRRAGRQRPAVRLSMRSRRRLDLVEQGDAASCIDVERGRPDGRRLPAALQPDLVGSGLPRGREHTPRAAGRVAEGVPSEVDDVGRPERRAALRDTTFPRPGASSISRSPGCAARRSTRNRPLQRRPRPAA